MLFKCIFLLICIAFPIINAANILYISILASKSHHIWYKAIVYELANRGHNITIISPYSEVNAPSNVHYILLENQVEVAQGIRAAMQAKDAMSPYYEVFSAQNLFYNYCSDSIGTNGFQTLVNYPNDFRFDLVLHDSAVGPCFQPFLHKFNYPPMIAVCAYGHASYLTHSIGGHNYYGYIPHNALTFDDRMTFWERFVNFLIYLEEYLLFEYNLIPRLDAIVAKHFGPNIPSVGDLEKRAALAFVNTNPVFDYVEPIPENVIPIAGVHIKDPRPLPKDLKEFIDSSKKGAVIFSLGTNYRSDFLSQANQNLFLDVFKSLPEYHFLWKFESNISSDVLPSNVRVQPWLPISDILGDSKVKAIFFHGGLLTTHEAVWRGVPMIIMPFGWDQKQNLIKSKRIGVAEGVNYLSLNRDEVRQTVLKVLEDPSYAANAAKASAKFRDQKEHPLERTVWWIEWLIRNSDADHMKSPVLQLGFIAANAYDIIIFVALFVAAVIVVLIKFICSCLDKIASRKCVLKPVHSDKKQN